MITRREFLSHATAGGGLAIIGASAPRLWLQAAAAAEKTTDQPILVVVELEGGNDGLNTVVPYADDVYHQSRPVLRIDPKDVLKLNDQLGLHPAMEELHALWDKGQCRIVGNVGYPEPNRSHFRSREIWHSASVPQSRPDGWLGRAADQRATLGICHVGDEAVPLAVRGRKAATMSIANLAEYRLERGARLAATAPLQGDVVLDEIQSRFRVAGDLASRLPAAMREAAASAGTTDGLAARLTTVRALIKHEPRFRVFYTSIGGFDTHSSQRFTHQSLLGQVSSGIAGFVSDLSEDGLEERVAVLVFSEFGRRLRENGQAGTDHGAAAPMFLIGGPVQGGLLGEAPDLQNLDQAGDVRFRIDFRDVYATLLGRWLNVDPVPILGERNDSLPLV